MCFIKVEVLRGLSADFHLLRGMWCCFSFLDISKLLFCYNEAVAKNLMGIKVKAGRTDATHVYGLALKCNSEIYLAARPGKSAHVYVCYR